MSITTHPTPKAGPRETRRRHTRRLLSAARREPQERNRLINEAVELNLEVARSLSSRYTGRGIDREDLEQTATAALVRAARSFDPARSEDFLSYAVPTIRGELKKYFRDSGWMVRPPRRIQELQSRVSAARSRLAQANAREPALAELAEETGETLSAVEEAMAADGCFEPSSLDRRLGDETDATLHDLLPDQDSGFDVAEARLLLEPAVRRLGERDRSILGMRYWEGLTQREIGERIGVTQMQVSRLLTRIVGELRDRVSPPRPGPAGARFGPGRT